MMGKISGAAAQPAALVLLCVSLSACQQQSTAPALDEAAVRQDIQKLTEDLYWIHLRLDTAQSALDQAELSMEGGELSAVAFQLDEARRAMQKADDRVLEIGQDLQQTFGLDRH